MAPEFTVIARRLGIVSAAGTVSLIVVYAITLVAGLMSLQSPQQPIGDPLFSILEILIILMMSVMVALMVAVRQFHQCGVIVSVIESRCLADVRASMAAQRGVKRVVERCQGHQPVKRRPL